MPPLLDTQGMVYFLQPVDGGPVKIGFTIDLRKRLVTIQTSSPVPLRLVALISDCKASDESRLHRMFSESRLHGEWFTPVPELVAIIEAHSEIDSQYVAEDVVQWMEAVDRRLSIHRPKRSADEIAVEKFRQRPFRRVA